MYIALERTAVPTSEILTFDDPPVNEVALGRTFLPRPDFLLPHFGGFWQRVSSKFPKPEHAPPIFDQASVEASPDPYFLPRVWLTSADGTTLLQIQQDRLHFNWRQTEASTSYVRFPTIQAEFLGAWKEFEQYVLEATGQPLQPMSGELSYVNFITVEGATSSVDVLDESLRDFRSERPPRFLPRPVGFNLVNTYQIPGTSDSFKVSVVSARKKAGGAPGVRLELTVSGNCSSDASFDEWSTRAHDFLVQGFKDLTTPAMHRQWNYRGAK